MKAEYSPEHQMMDEAAAFFRAAGRERMRLVMDFRDAVDSARNIDLAVIEMRALASRELHWTIQVAVAEAEV
jgi:hypothetical protein